MKIEINKIPESTIEDFAIASNLTMEMNERPSVGFYKNLDRWYCQFKSAVLLSEDGNFLHDVTGNGNTQEIAIADYARRISEGTLVIDAWRDSRKEIKVPRLIPKED